MANKLENHYVVVFAKNVLKYIELGKINGISITDKTLMEHIIRNKITDYAAVKLINDTLLKNKEILESYGLKYTSLAEANDKLIQEKKVFQYINIQIVGDNNVIEIRLPFLTRAKFDPLIKFFKEELDMEFEKRRDTDPVWFTYIRDESIFDDILNNPLVKDIGYEIDKAKVKKAVERIAIEKEKQKKLFNLSVTSKLNDSAEFKGLFEKFYPFQKVALEYSKHKSSILIADEMGLGKTLQAIGIMEYHQLYPAVIVVPANLKKNWV